jgi:LemA protein
MGAGVAIIVLIVAVVLVLILIGLFNKFVRLRNRANNAWAQVDLQLRRRYDLIPNLVETVKGYATHEREVFERVTEARTAGIAAKTVAEQGQAENVLTSALRQLFAVAEAYPELKANQNFLELQNEISEIEQQILISRQIFNDTVLAYNNAIQTFPGVLLAGSFGFGQRDYLEIEEGAKAPVQVDFRDMPGRDAPQPPSGQQTPPAAPPQP